MIPDADQVAFPDPIDGQGRNERGAYAGSIFCGKNDDLVRVVVGPVENLAQRLGTAGFEVRIFVEDRTVGADMAGLDVFLLADRGDATGREAGCSSANELGEPTAHLQLCLSSLDVEGLLKELPCFQQVFVRVLLDGGKKGGIQRIRLPQFGHILSLKNETWLVIDDIDQGQTEDFTEVETRGHLFKCLLTRARRVTVDDEIIRSPRQHNMLIIESAVFAVDSHGGVRWQLEMSDLGHRSRVLHVSGIDSGTEDTANLNRRIGISRGDERSSRIVDQGNDFDGQSLIGEGLCGSVLANSNESSHAIWRMGGKGGGGLLQCFNGHILSSPGLPRRGPPRPCPPLRRYRSLLSTVGEYHDRCIPVWPDRRT